MNMHYILTYHAVALIMVLGSLRNHDSDAEDNVD